VWKPCNDRYPHVNYERRSIYRSNGGILRGLFSVYPLLRKGMTMENLLVGSIAVLLLGYLFYALIRPEKF
jgi:K+-transporting ATPase KdpF subunit